MPITNPPTDLPRGIGRPATRALAAAGITRLEQLPQRAELDLLQLHGVGPKAIDVLRQALAERRLHFRTASPKTAAKTPGTPRAAPTTKRSGTPSEATRGPDAIDAYLDTLPADQRAALQRLRETIHSAAPGATEVIGYGIPLFKLVRSLVGFNAAGAHCTFQLMSTAVLEAHAADLKGFPTGKGSIRFTPEKPLPAALIKKLVKARIAENDRLSKQPKSSKTGNR